MRNIGKRLEDLKRHVEATRRPVRINVVQEGEQGKEDEVELLYTVVLTNPSGDEKLRAKDVGPGP